MTVDAKGLLEILVIEARKTSDSYLISARLPDEFVKARGDLCDELKGLGCIEHVGYVGKNSVRCVVNIIQSEHYLNTCAKCLKKESMQ